VPPMIGRVDVVVVDGRRAITLVECKLSKNREHHGAVVGQLLSYAAGLSRRGYNDFKERFEKGRFGDGRASLTGLFEGEPQWDPDRFSREISDNLAAGRFHLAIAAAETSLQLRRTLGFVREQMPDVDLELIEFDNAHAPPPKRPEDLLETIRAISGPAGEAAEALLLWAKENEPQIRFLVSGYDGLIRGRRTVCRIKRHRELRVSLDKLGMAGEARVEQLRRDLKGLSFEADGKRAKAKLETLQVDDFLAAMAPIIERLT